jgi:phosphoribosyl 1,2-cyclic phosphodiesterase
VNGVRISFFGVRGSTPCCSASLARYGGNTACVVLQPDHGDPVILDLGTGMRAYGCAWPADRAFRGTALVSHLHWDHVQGLPFFSPLCNPDSRLDIYGPGQEDGLSMAAALDAFMVPPYFPITLDQLPAEFRIADCPKELFQVGSAKITALEVPHIGRTLGFRIEADGVTVAYIPDHQQPYDGSYQVAPNVLELCRNADLVIHDAQFTDDEFARKFNWGHCTIGYAVEVAAQAGARRLALFHHDPSHDDERMDELATKAVAVGRVAGVEVFAASEGLQVQLAPARYARRI